MTNLLGLPACYGFPVRDEPPNVLEYTAAEYWVRESYRRYFQDAGGIPQLITWQLERLFNPYLINDPVLELAMEMLESDFRNVFSNATLARFKSMVKNGASAVEVLKLIREASPGGDRKPDMLGISASGGPLLFDSVEVGTVKTAQPTYDELVEKMDIVRTAVIPQIKLRLPALQARAARAFKSMNVPTDFVVRPSPFRLAPSEMIIPVPVRVIPSQGDKPALVDWICYHPTTVWTPSGASPAPGSGAPTGTDGVVLYHIHQAALPELPDRVHERVAKEMQRWKQSQGLILELNPALVGALDASKSDWSPDARRLFAYLGAGALVLIVIGVAWEIGLFAAGAAIAEAGMTALAATPAELLVLVRASAAVAAQLWPAAVAAAPLLPITQR